jgi:RHS repeat-associated protein
VNGSLTNVLVYDAGGKLLAEYGPPAGSGGTQYAFADPQGSPRVITGAGGNVISRHDYAPFGEELSAIGMRTSGQGYGAGDNARQKYAGMESDDAGSLAHTLWRQYDNLSGRWTAPDPYGGSMSVASPQSFNRYSYVNNNPVNSVDLTGLMLSDIGVYQTDDTRDAGIAEHQALRDFQVEINADWASRNGVIVSYEGNKAVVSSGHEAPSDQGDAGSADRLYQHSRGRKQQGPGGGRLWNSNAIMVIAWSAPEKTISDPESLNPDEWLGHVSMITMDDDTSYSWDGTGGEHYWSQEYKRVTPSSIYTKTRSEESYGTGYILDFGVSLNAKFQKAMKHAYDGIRSWDPYYHNCTYGFVMAFNAIARDLGMNRQDFHRPVAVENFIKKYLPPYTKGTIEFPKR